MNSARNLAGERVVAANASAIIQTGSSNYALEWKSDEVGDAELSGAGLTSGNRFRAGVAQLFKEQVFETATTWQFQTSALHQCGSAAQLADSAASN